MAEFPYITNQFLESESLTPSIPVRLGNGYQTVGLLDSGSDVTVIPRWLARKLDLSPRVLRRSWSIAGSGFVERSFMKISVDTLHQLEVPVDILLSDEKIPVLLGRDGFFDAFRICFDQSKKIVEIRPIASS